MVGGFSIVAVPIYFPVNDDTGVNYILRSTAIKYLDFLRCRQSTGSSSIMYLAGLPPEAFDI